MVGDRPGTARRPPRIRPLARLDTGWSEDTTITDAPRIVRRRFDILTEMLDLDRGRAAAWTVARLLQNALWDVEDGHTAIGAAAKTIDDALPDLHG